MEYYENEKVNAGLSKVGPSADSKQMVADNTLLLSRSVQDTSGNPDDYLPMEFKKTSTNIYQNVSYDSNQDCASKKSETLISSDMHVQSNQMKGLNLDKIQCGNFTNNTYLNQEQKLIHDAQLQQIKNFKPTVPLLPDMNKYLVIRFDDDQRKHIATNLACENTVSLENFREESNPQCDVINIPSTQKYFTESKKKSKFCNKKSLKILFTIFLVILAVINIIVLIYFFQIQTNRTKNSIFSVEINDFLKYLNCFEDNQNQAPGGNRKLQWDLDKKKTQGKKAIFSLKSLLSNFRSTPIEFEKSIGALSRNFEKLKGMCSNSLELVDEKIHSHI